MKKAISILCILAALFSFCSCSELPIAKDINELLMSEIYTDWDNFSYEKIVDKGSIYKNYFDDLSINQKKAYNNIFNEVMNAEDSFPERIEVPSMSGDDLSQVYEAVIYDNPEIMCFGNGANIVSEGSLCFFEPDYTMTPQEQNDGISLLNEFAEEMNSHLSDDMTDFEKELYIHDILVKRCIYDCDTDGTNLAYSCIVNGIASCEGYSKATKFLLEKAGIECYNVIGDAKNMQGEYESHMWNIVKIDGSYYYLDTTWDDPTEDADVISHVYFNITEDELSIDHSNFEPFFSCDSTESNYFVKTDTLYSSSDYYSIQKMQNAALNNLKKSRNNVEFRFTSKEAFNNAIYALITESKAYTIQENIKYLYPNIQLSDEINYSKNDDHLVLEFVF